MSKRRPKIIVHNYFKTRDTSPDQVEQRYKQLRGMERSQLERLVAGRLDPSHLRSEGKAVLVSTVLHAEFGRKDIEAWHNHHKARDTSAGTASSQMQPEAHAEGVEAKRKGEPNHNPYPKYGRKWEAYNYGYEHTSARDVGTGYAAYHAGIAAAANGEVTQGQNPHWPGTLEYEAWRRGFTSKGKVASQPQSERVYDTWYHHKQINGYYILKGAAGDEGRWLVRNGKYDIVKTVSSQAEAESFAKRQSNGGAQQQQQIAVDGGPGSGPQPGGGSKQKYVEKKNLSPTAKKKEGVTHYITKAPQSLWSKLRYGGN